MTHSNPPTDERGAVEKLLRFQDVMDLTALSRASIYREIENGGFPKPIKFGKASRWSASEIMRHIEDRKARR